MLKLFTTKQQATRKRSATTRKGFDQQRWLRITYFILALSLIVWGWQFLHNSKILPIEKVQIEGAYNFVSQEELQNAIQPYLNTGFFNVNEQAIVQSLENLPWVYSATVSRLWPHNLIIHIVEQQPIAVWGKNALVNIQGRLFYPSPKTFPLGLPILNGLVDQQQTAINDFKKFTQILAPLNLNIAELAVTPRQAVQIILTNGIEIYLGKNNIVTRLQRFAGVYREIFQDKSNLVQYVDMRYTNGMAVMWKQT